MRTAGWQKASGQRAAPKGAVGTTSRCAEVLLTRTHLDTDVRCDVAHPKAIAHACRTPERIERLTVSIDSIEGDRNWTQAPEGPFHPVSR